MCWSGHLKHVAHPTVVFFIINEKISLLIDSMSAKLHMGLFLRHGLIRRVSTSCLSLRCRTKIWPWQDQCYSCGHLLFCLHHLLEELFCLPFFGIPLALSPQLPPTQGSVCVPSLTDEVPFSRNLNLQGRCTWAEGCWSWIMMAMLKRLSLPFLTLSASCTPEPC